MAGRFVMGLLALVVLFILVGLGLPRHYHLQREIVIEQPLPVAYELLNGFSRFSQWSPWAERDPAAEYRLTGPAWGPGSGVSWQGRARLVGNGRLEIIEDVPFSRIDMSLALAGQGQARMRFTLEQSAAGVAVHWQLLADLGPGRFMIDGILRRYLALQLHHWVEAQMEQGLSRLQDLAGAADFKAEGRYPVSQRDMPRQRIVQLAVEPGEASESDIASTAAAFRELVMFLALYGLEAAGAPMVITEAHGDGSRTMNAAIPVTAEVPLVDTRVRFGWSPAGQVAQWRHQGPARGLPESYRLLQAYLLARKLQPGPVSWEQYLTDPASTAPGGRVTLLNVTVATDS